MRTGHFVIVLAAGLVTVPAFATQQRSFVASNGVDTNNCTIAAPCRSFGVAINQTNAGGEVIVQDSAGYGPVTITKSVSLIAPAGVYAGITVFTGDGITVNAPGATVVLRGLSINGQGGVTGVNVQKVARLRIENCVVSNMAGNGLYHIAPSDDLIIVDTIVRDNGGTGIGISASTIVVLDHVRSEHNSYDGFYMDPGSSPGYATATITNSVFAANLANGVSAKSSTGPLSVSVDRTVASRNSIGGFLVSGTFAHLYANSSVATDNSFDFWQDNSGTLYSTSTNLILVRLGAITTVLPQ